MVAQLAAGGMVAAVEGASPPAHRYLPEPQLAAMLDQLAACYRSHLVEVTDLIHSKTGRLAQQFADAFKWKKDS